MNKAIKTTIEVLEKLQKDLHKKEIRLDQLEDSYYSTDGINEEALEFEDLRVYLEEDVEICYDMQSQIISLIEHIKRPEFNYTNEEYKKKIQKIIDKQLKKSSS